MKTRGFWCLEEMSDVELVAGLRSCVGQSAWTEARLVAHLAELESRRLHLTVSRSLFAYCQERLGLSQNEAYYRIVAARLGRKFPIVFELLEQHKVHLTALALIRDHITADNHLELLNDVSGKTKEQILHLLAARQPRPDARSHLRRLPSRGDSIAAGPSGRLEPLSVDRYRLELCIGPELKQKLERAADLMSHANPSRDLAIVVERALDQLIERLQKQRFGQTSRPRSSLSRSEQPRCGTAAGTKLGQPEPATPEGLHPAFACDRDEGVRTSTEASLPRRSAPVNVRKRDRIRNALRRQLLARDGASCTFVLSDGTRCGAQAFLQIHHDQAWAKGGADALANLRLVCASHNRLLAEQEFGAAHVAAVVVARRRAG